MQRTSFVGRQQELDGVQALVTVDGARLITLTGPGGIGKTRLAVAAAAALAERYADGAWFVDLAPLADPGLVGVAFAHALGVPTTAAREVVESLREYTASRAMLLVVDNCEHVLEAMSLLTALVEASPRLTILSTSRMRLQLPGEHEYPVPCLAVPDGEARLEIAQLAECEAVALFVQRARVARPDFRLNESNAAAVAAVCRRLDGLPLALELAAAWSKVLSPRAMSARLQPGLDLLASGSRVGPARHQTLRDTLAWSHDLLDQPEQEVFARLGVFAGGCTLDAAEEICGSGVRQLAALVDRSLLRVEDDADGEPRFHMLETTHEFAREKLGLEPEDSDDVRSRHAMHYLQLAERAEPELRGPHQAQWLARLEREHDNLRTALVFSNKAGRAETAQRLAAALWKFWEVHGYLNEGEQWLGAALSLDADAALPSSARAKALNALGNLAYVRGDYQWASSLHESSLGLRRQLADARGTAQCLLNLGSVAAASGDAASAATWSGEALTAFRAIGDAWGTATSLNGLGMALISQAAYPAARAHLEESLAQFRALADRRGVAAALSNLADVAQGEGKYAAAAALVGECLAISRELQDYAASAACLQSLAAAVAGLGQADLAACLLGAAEGLRGAVDAKLPPAFRSEHDRMQDQLRRALGENGLAAAWMRGRSLTFDQAVEMALQSATNSARAPLSVTGPDALLLANRYLLAEVLGSGGSGTVYRATDQRTGGAVAVKLLHSHLAGDVEYTTRLRREAAITASLTSPRVVRVIDLAEHGGVPFLVMEYVPGPTLRDHLTQQGRLPAAESLTIALEIARALTAASAAGVVHRDLKPHNVKLIDGQVKVLDFGIARAASSPALTTTGTYLGTPYYSAPEQVEGRGDTRADIYALGVILYELVAGRLPFRGRTPLAVLRQHAEASPPPLDANVPPAVQRVIARCLAKEPAARYQTPLALCRELEQALNSALVDPGRSRRRSSGAHRSRHQAVTLDHSPLDGERQKGRTLVRPAWR